MVGNNTNTEDDTIEDDEHYGDSQDESQKETMQATVHGVIDEDQRMEVRHSISVQNIHDADLDENQDDFMETYMAINSKLKVRESQGTSRMQRHNVKTSARDSSSKATSLY